jgi:hypothetical protein
VTSRENKQELGTQDGNHSRGVKKWVWVSFMNHKADVWSFGSPSGRTIYAKLLHHTAGATQNAIKVYKHREGPLHKSRQTGRVQPASETRALHSVRVEYDPELTHE